MGGVVADVGVDEAGVVILCVLDCVCLCMILLKGMIRVRIVVICDFCSSRGFVSWGRGCI